MNLHLIYDYMKVFVYLLAYLLYRKFSLAHQWLQEATFVQTGILRQMLQNKALFQPFLSSLQPSFPLSSFSLSISVFEPSVCFKMQRLRKTWTLLENSTQLK